MAWLEYRLPSMMQKILSCPVSPDPRFFGALGAMKTQTCMTKRAACSNDQQPSSKGRFSITASSEYFHFHFLAVGKTVGRGKKSRVHEQIIPVKDIWLYPLRRNFRAAR